MNIHDPIPSHHPAGVNSIHPEVSPCDNSPPPEDPSQDAVSTGFKVNREPQALSVANKSYVQTKGKRKFTPLGWVHHMNRTYDRNFLISLTLQYFNNGMKSMVSLACLDMFNATYHLEPSET